MVVSTNPNLRLFNRDGWASGGNCLDCLQFIQHRSIWVALNCARVALESPSQKPGSHMFKIVSLGLLVFLSSFRAEAVVGGYMSRCYNGNFVSGIWCQEDTREYRVNISEQHEIRIIAVARARYIDSQGSGVQIELDLRIEDPANYFDPEAELPVLLRTITASYHREYIYRVKSEPVIFTRNYGQRSLSSTRSIQLHNNWGAEYVEYLMKLEMLVPGVAGVSVLNF